MRISWLARARHDLTGIAAYIEQQNPLAATKVEHRIRTAVEHLQEFPRAGRISHRVGTREVVITEYPYVIRYRVAGDQIQILRIFHTSTNWMTR